MKKMNLANWLSALCAVLLIILLVLQSKQKSQLDLLRQQDEAFVSSTAQRQQEAFDAVAKLAEQVTTLGTNLNAQLVQGGQQTKEMMAETMNAVQQLTAFAQNSEQQQKGQRLERETNFRELHQQLDDLV